MEDYRFGGHIIINADTTELDLYGIFGQTPIIYTDPPWNDYWVTRFSEGKHKSFIDLITNMAIQFKKFSSIMYIEMGRANIDTFLEIMDYNKATMLNLWKLPYKTSYSYLYRGYFNGKHEALQKELPSGKGDEPIIELLDQDIKTSLWEQPSTILDPFIGVDGRTLFMAEKLGIKCRGVEISPLKVKKLIDKYYRIYGK